MVPINSDVVLPTTVKNANNLQRENWALLAHVQAVATLLREKNTENLISDVCKSISNQYPYDLAFVGFPENDADQTIRVVGASGLAAEYASNIHVSWSIDTEFGRGPIGTCVRSGLIALIDDTQIDPTFIPWRERAHKFGLRSCIAVPILGENSVLLGALTVYASIPSAFGETELILFKGLAADIGYGLDSISRQKILDDEIHQRQSAQEKLAEALRATVEAMSRTMEWRDPYTAGHQKRVAEISVAIAKELGWPEDRIRGLYTAAMVHDLGKVAVPSEILTKPSKLSELEMKLVEAHVEAGHQILQDIPFPWPVAEMVYQHHERLDGSGYPRGLSGEQICEESRVLAVADTLEAMASHRPYRPAKSLDETLKLIASEAGIQFDKKVVDALMMIAKNKEAIRVLLNS